MVHKRQIYNILDLMGDFGGVKEVICLLVALIMAPFAEHSFLLKAIQKLYLAHTKDEKLFEMPKSQKS